MRNAFIGKVLSVVFCQLLVTIGLSLTFYYVDPLRLYVRQNAWPFYASIALTFGLLIGMACSEKLRRVYPYNVLALAAFTLVMGFQVATITSYFDTQSVMLAFMATCFVVAGCAFIAFCTKLDMTKYAAYLSIAGLAFIAVALIAAFWPWRGGTRNWTIIAISFVGCLLFSAYLIFDLQLLVGGRTLSIGPDDWVFASISIYLDIINSEFVGRGGVWRGKGSKRESKTQTLNQKSSTPPSIQQSSCSCCKSLRCSTTTTEWGGEAVGEREQRERAVNTEEGAGGRPAPSFSIPLPHTHACERLRFSLFFLLSTQPPKMFFQTSFSK